MLVEFTAAARLEFDDVFDWYAERSPGAAIAFVAEVETALESIAADPDRFQRTDAGCQLCRLKRYPYCVVYRRTGDVVRVVAVAHAKRRPGYWRRRP